MASPYFLTDYPYLFEFLLNSGEELAGNILKSTTLETGGNAYQLYLYTAGILGRISNSQIFYLSGDGN